MQRFVWRRFGKDGKITTLDVNEDLAYLPKNILQKANMLLR
jgi:predicted O-methyltransferase YrrM